MRPRLIVVLSVLLTSLCSIPKYLNVIEYDTTQMRERAEWKSPMVVEEMMDIAGFSPPGPAPNNTCPAKHLDVLNRQCAADNLTQALEMAKDQSPMVVGEMMDISGFSPPEPALENTCPAKHLDEWNRKCAIDDIHLNSSDMLLLMWNMTQGFDEFGTMRPATCSSLELCLRYLLESLIQALLESLRHLLAIAEKAPAHFWLVLISRFWYFRTGREKCITILYLMSIVIEQNLDPDSYLSWVCSVTFLILEVATYFPWIRKWIMKRALCKPGKKQASSSTRVTQHQGPQPVSSTARPAPQQISTIDSELKEGTLCLWSSEPPAISLGQKKHCPPNKSASGLRFMEKLASIDTAKKRRIPDVSAEPPAPHLSCLWSSEPEAIGLGQGKNWAIISPAPMRNIPDVPSSPSSEPQAAQWKSASNLQSSSDSVLKEDNVTISVISESSISHESSSSESPASDLFTKLQSSFWY